MTVAGVLLDLDDTILAFDSVTEQAWAEVCARHAPALDCSADRLQAAIRQTARWFWGDPARHRWGRLDLVRARREIVDLALRQLHVDGGSAGDRIADDYAEAREAAIRPLPGAMEAVAQWRRAGLRLAMVTNGAAADQRRKIDRFGLAPLFDVILVEGEVGFGKPDRRIFALALRRLGLAAAQVYMVGDSLAFDVAGAQQLGIHTVWIDAQGRGMPPEGAVRPDACVRLLADLTTVIGA
jgi:putative hydrolase of the HAD superfamily